LDNAHGNIAFLSLFDWLLRATSALVKSPLENSLSGNSGNQDVWKYKNIIVGKVFMTQNNSGYLSKKNWHMLNILGKLQNIETGGSISKIYNNLKWQSHLFQGAESEPLKNRAIKTVSAKLVGSHRRAMDSAE